MYWPGLPTYTTSDKNTPYPFYLTTHIIIRFCGLKGHERFCRVPKAFIEDNFNLHELWLCLPHPVYFKDSRDEILDRGTRPLKYAKVVMENACALYVLIHARFIITIPGLKKMREKVSIRSAENCIRCVLFIANVNDIFDIFFLHSTVPPNSVGVLDVNAKGTVFCQLVQGIKQTLALPKYFAPSANRYIPTLSK